MNTAAPSMHRNHEHYDTRMTQREVPPRPVSKHVARDKIQIGKLQVEFRLGLGEGGKPRQKQRDAKSSILRSKEERVRQQLPKSNMDFVPQGNYAIL
jgi:hypothetical protein